MSADTAELAEIIRAAMANADLEAFLSKCADNRKGRLGRRVEFGYRAQVADNAKGWSSTTPW